MIKSTTFRPYHARIPPEDPDLLRGWLTRELMAIERALQPQSIQTALTTSGSTVSSPMVSAWDHTSIQCQFTGTIGSTAFTDDTGNLLTANGNAVISGTNGPFGAPSAYFDGGSNTTSVTTAASVGSDLGADDFTLEGWIKTSQTGQQYTGIVNHTDASFSAGSWSLLFNTNTATDGQPSFWVREFSASTPLIAPLGGGPKINDGIWHHLLVERAMNNWYLFIDGVSGGSYRWNGTLAVGVQNTMFGNDHQFNRGLLGYLGPWRLLRRYVGYHLVNGVFTPAVPTAPFPTS